MIWQEGDPGVRVNGQVFPVMLNGAAGLTNPVIFRLAVPVLLTVTFKLEVVPTGVLGKGRLVGFTTICGVVTPLPLRLTVAAKAGAAGVMVMLEETAPVVEGVNDTVSWQLLPTARIAGDIGQLLLLLKGNASALNELMVNGNVPSLVIVTICWPVCNTWTLPKSTVRGLTVICGAPRPVP